MSEITRVGVDLAKNVIQVHAVDTAGMFATIAWLCLIAAGAYSLITWWERRSAIVEALT